MAPYCEELIEKKKYCEPQTVRETLVECDLAAISDIMFSPYYPQCVAAAQESIQSHKSTLLHISVGNMVDHFSHNSDWVTKAAVTGETRGVKFIFHRVAKSALWLFLKGQMELQNAMQLLLNVK